MAVKVLEQVAGDFNPRSSLEPLLHHRLSHPHIVAMFDVCTQVGAGRRSRECVCSWALRQFALEQPQPAGTRNGGCGVDQRVKCDYGEARGY